MGKIRVYELAKEIGIPSKELVDFLEELGAEIKNHMSTIEDDIAEMVIDHFKPAPQDTPERAKKAAKPVAVPDDHDLDEDLEEKGKPVSKHKSRPEARKEKGTERHVAPPARGKDRQPPGKQSPSGKQPAPKSKKVIIPGEITVGELAEGLSVTPAQLITTLMGMGVMAAVTQVISPEVAEAAARKFGFEVEKGPAQTEEAAKVAIGGEIDPPEKLKPRPPVVTIMGHVDHGKTTLLDAIQETKVAAGETGGITQHIGAYQVEFNDRKITFIDTPGHEAFTAMRSRGAQVTDIAILVVAADDGVMPQTIEAINHAKAANVPIIVAINKMDRPGANPDRVLQQLSEHELIPESWGGDTICVPVSALKKEGLDDLLEMILLVAEMRELKANPDRKAKGTIIEAELDKGRGPVATVLVQNGTLHVGDAIIAGSVAGKVRALVDDKGRRVKSAGPSQPVELLGLSDIPRAGDILVAVENDRDARQIASKRQQSEREQELKKTARVSLGELFSKLQEGIKELNIVLKADVQGSVEALRQSLENLSNEKVRVNVIHGAVGAITETDVNLAAASEAIIIGFNVRPESTARRAAEKDDVDINLYRIIYEAIDDVKKAMVGMLEPEYRERVVGRAEVRATFRVPGVGTIAGCYVQEGRITRTAAVRVLRDNIVVHEGKISSLKRFKDDVREVAQGYECGIGIERYNDLKDGDVLEAFVMEEIARTGT